MACSVNASSVSTNQAAVFTATGGNGTYSWSGPNLSVTNASGSQFAVSYPNPGTYTITVTSAGESTSCNMTVVAAATTGTLACSPATQNVTLGQTASFSATGGNGSYTWSSPDLSITNASGSGFSANYASTGLKTMTVSSNGATASCVTNVLAGSPVTTPVLLRACQTQAAVMDNSNKHIDKSFWTKGFLLSFCVGLLVAGLSVFLQTREATVQAFSAAASAPIAVAAAPAGLGSSFKEPGNPRGLSSPQSALMRTSKVLGSIGTATATMSIPTNFTDVGWYNGGPLPGAPGERRDRRTLRRERC